MKTKTKKYLVVLSVLVVFVISLFLRIWHLNKIPPGIWYDEAYNGLDAIKALEQHHYKIFYPENYGREGLYINILAWSFKLFGINNFALRFSSAIIGFLTVIGFYFWLRSLRLYHTTAILGAFALGTSFYHLNFSRIAFRAIMVPFLLTWSLFFFTKGCYLTKKTTKKTRGIFHLINTPLFTFFLAGLFTGLGLHTYIAYRVVPLIFIIIFFVCLIVEKHFLKKYWKKLLIFLLGAIISAGPLLWYFKNHPSEFTGRTDAVSIFNAPNLNLGQAFLKSLSLHLQSIIFIGDGNQRHNYNSFPLLPAVWSLFFLIGFLMSLKEIFVGVLKYIKKEKIPKLFLPSLTGQAIFWIMLIPGVLSMEGIPHFLRIIGITPAVFLFVVLPFEYLRRLYIHLKTSPFYSVKLWRWKIMRNSFLVLIITFFLAGFFQSYLYFKFWATSPKTTEAFQGDLFSFGQFIKQQPIKQQNYLLLQDNVSINPINRSDFSEKSLLFSAMPIIKKYQAYKLKKELDLLLNKQDLDCSNSQFILQPNNPLLPLKKIQNYCRNLKLQEFTINIPNQSPVKVWLLR